MHIFAPIPKIAEKMARGNYPCTQPRADTYPSVHSLLYSNVSKFGVVDERIWLGCLVLVE